MRLIFPTVLLVCGVSATAFAQRQTEMEVEAEENRPPRFSIELEPLSTALSLIPGVGSVGMSFEQYLGNKWAAFVEGSYADVDVKTDWLQEMREETDAPLVEKAYGYSVGGGLRYYASPENDSWYGGGAVNYGETDATWTYEATTFDSQLYTVSPSLFAGYRWVWDNGVLVRIGAGATTPTVQSEVIEAREQTEDVEEGTSEIEDFQSQPVLARVDFGLGYAF